MRVLLTGAGGFVGRWLTRELESTGHVAIAPLGRSSLDVTDHAAVGRALKDARPDAVAHLAAVSFGPDARADPEAALRVNVAGTLNVVDVAATLPDPPAILVTGSSEVYGSPPARDLPLREDSRLRPRSTYALTKTAQEAVALSRARDRPDLRVVVTRSFNHTGPGQRASFVVPALAGRVRDAARGTAREVRVGNIDVRRDFTDVRDVVRAYRLLLERLATLERGDDALGGVVNVCSGRSVSIREILDRLCQLAAVRVPYTTDPSLVRTDDAPEIVGDATRLRTLTDWRPEIELEVTLRDVWEEVAGGSPTDASADVAPG